MKIIKLKQYSKGENFEFATLVIKDHFWNKEREIDLYRYDSGFFWTDEKTQNRFDDHGFVDNILREKSVKECNARRKKLIEADKPIAKILYRS